MYTQSTCTSEECLLGSQQAGKLHVKHSKSPRGLEREGKRETNEGMDSLGLEDFPRIFDDDYSI